MYFKHHFLQRSQKRAVVEKMGCGKKSSGTSTWAFSEHVGGQASEEETVALGRDLGRALGKSR